jgi:hypothetical protein
MSLIGLQIRCLTGLSHLYICLFLLHIQSLAHPFQCWTPSLGGFARTLTILVLYPTFWGDLDQFFLLLGIHGLIQYFKGSTGGTLAGVLIGFLGLCRLFHGNWVNPSLLFFVIVSSHFGGVLSGTSQKRFPCS